jgi:hypothetical protein
MLKIAHIINPVSVGEASDLYFAQPITFESMRAAQAFARGKVTVDLYTTQYEEDHRVLPQGFLTLSDLTRSLTDMGTFQKPRKLPLLRDILDKVYEGAPSADYIIYTNVDIALMPHFYVVVAKLLQEYDGMVINRRTISEKYKSVTDIALMYMEIGDKHPGYDCFVFKRSCYPQFHLKDAVIGSVGIGNLLYLNVLQNAQNFSELKSANLTFHIGDDRVWKSSQFKDQEAYNRQQVRQSLLAIREEVGGFTDASAIGCELIERYKSGGARWVADEIEADNVSLSVKRPTRWRRLKRKVAGGMRRILHGALGIQ